MSKKFISLVNDKEVNDSNIKLSDSPLGGTLIYAKSNGGDYVAVNNHPDFKSVEERIVNCFELKNRLASKFWFNGILKIYNSKQNSYSLIDPITYLNTTTLKQYFEKTNPNYLTIKNNIENYEKKIIRESVSISNKDLLDLNDTYNKLFPDGNTINNFCSNYLSNGTFDNEISLVSDDCIVNSISLGKYARKNNSFCNLSILYYKKDKEFIVNKKFPINKGIDFIIELEDVRIEFINNVVRVFPTNTNEISGCIIKNCNISFSHGK